jgi:integrase
MARLADGHSHRLRDTFSVALLEKGVPLETVSILLGHTSIKTTEKHYAPSLIDTGLIHTEVSDIDLKLSSIDRTLDSIDQKADLS